MWTMRAGLFLINRTIFTHGGSGISTPQQVFGIAQKGRENRAQEPRTFRDKGESAWVLKSCRIWCLTL
jgi:hypothetical protein